MKQKQKYNVKVSFVDQNDPEPAVSEADSLSDCKDEKHVGKDDGQPLKEHRARAGVVQVLHHQHVSVKVLSHMGQAELKPGEQRRVVQSPLRRVLKHSQTKRTIVTTSHMWRSFTELLTCHTLLRVNQTGTRLEPDTELNNHCTVGSCGIVGGF